MESLLTDLFADLGTLLTKWEEAEVKFEECLAKIENHLQQLEACHQIDDGQLKICAQFPDLKSNVASKVTAKVDLLRSDLFAAVDDWCCQSADIRSKCAKARELSLCDEDLLVKGGTASPLQPSKAQLLLWAGQTDTTLYIQELSFRQSAAISVDLRGVEKARTSFRMDLATKNKLKNIANLTSG